MENIHLIPTENSSITSIDDNGTLILHRNQWRKNTHYIYITSDEEINIETKPCWCVNTIKNTWNKDLIYHQGAMPQYHFIGFKKIILTTDPELIKDGIQAINDEFLEWFVKNPTCEKVEIVKKRDKWLEFEEKKSFVYKYKIIIPKEEPKTNLEKLQFPELIVELSKYYKVPIIFEKDETIEEAAIKYLDKKYPPRFEDETQQLINVGNKITIGLVDAFKQGAKWQQERSYSEEEVHRILGSYSAHKAVFGAEYTYDMWFEQFKKK